MRIALIGGSLSVVTMIVLSACSGGSGGTGSTSSAQRCNQDADCPGTMVCDPEAVSVGDGYCTPSCTQNSECTQRVTCPGFVAEPGKCEDAPNHKGKGYCDEFAGHFGPNTCGGTAGSSSGTSGTSGTSGGSSASSCNLDASQWGSKCGSGCGGVMQCLHVSSADGYLCEVPCQSDADCIAVGAKTCYIAKAAGNASTCNEPPTKCR
jgi:hypothetical protein